MSEGIHKKRVAALYRVSTKAQLDKITNDIPMQENACKAFIASKPGWALEKEYYERGVSGYKKKAEERDVLQQLKSDAQGGQFDILLVFMIDRLGRREDETPFIMKWFSDQGIEIWSVKEGRQYSDSRTDLLINFIKSWQSSGESEKTGIRVREKQSQMGKEGIFTGGNPPLGYDLVYSGKESKTGRRLKKLVVNDAEKDIIQTMYHLNVVYGYGGRRIALYLNQRGIKTKKGGQWSASTVNNLLKNPIYKGYPAYGKTTQVSGKWKHVNASEWSCPATQIKELALVDESLWDKARKLRSSRNTKQSHDGTTGAPLSTKGKLLLIGIAYCGHCGAKLHQHTDCVKWTTKKEGLKKKYMPSYQCRRKAGGHQCSGKYTYARNTIEKPVIDAVSLYLSQLEIIDLSQHMNRIQLEDIAEEENQLKENNKKSEQAARKLTSLHLEISNALDGNSAYTPEMLAASIAALEEETKKINNNIALQKTSIDRKRKNINTDKHYQSLIPDWKEEFELAPPEIKSMLLAELIENIAVFRDKIEIRLHLSYNDFIAVKSL